MDAARRWQVASLVAAVTSVGIGGILLNRPSTEPAAPIQLDIVDAAVDLDVVPANESDRTPVDVPPEIVSPDAGVVGDSATAPSSASVASPEDGGTASTGSSSSSTSTTTSGTGSGSTSTAGTTSSRVPAPAPATDSPSSVSSDDSIDSDD